MNCIEIFIYMQKYSCSVSLCNFGNVNNRLVEWKQQNMTDKLLKNKPLYWKIYSIHQTDRIYLDIWRRILKQSLNMYWMNSLFKWLRMLPFKVIFQNLDGGKYV